MSRKCQGGRKKSPGLSRTPVFFGISSRPAVVFGFPAATAQVGTTGKPKETLSAAPIRCPSLATIPRMALSDAPEALAYYTVTQNERTGWTGGLLVLNHTGRPLEFQCTLPVRPSRAHEILYGPTLQEHLIGEVIAPVLLKKCRTPIAMICCDQPESFRVREHLDVPVALAVEAAEAEEGPITIDTMPDTETLPFAKGHLCVLTRQTDRVRGLSDRFRDFPDLVEPFDRIREAIREAQVQLARAA